MKQTQSIPSPTVGACARMHARESLLQAASRPVTGATRSQPGAHRPYWTLLVLHRNEWCIAFGDYSRPVVVDEAEEVYGEDTARIIVSSDGQADIDAIVARMNDRGAVA